MEVIIEYLPFIVPLVVVQYTLAIIALVHLFRHPDYRFGNKLLWILIVLLVQIIGPVVYFIFGRGEEE